MGWQYLELYMNSPVSCAFAPKSLSTSAGGGSSELLLEGSCASTARPLVLAGAALLFSLASLSILALLAAPEMGSSSSSLSDSLPDVRSPLSSLPYATRASISTKTGEAIPASALMSGDIVCCGTCAAEAEEGRIEEGTTNFVSCLLLAARHPLSCKHFRADGHCCMETRLPATVLAVHHRGRRLKETPLLSPSSVARSCLFPTPPAPPHPRHHATKSLYATSPACCGSSCNFARSSCSGLRFSPSFSSSGPTDCVCTRPEPDGSSSPNARDSWKADE